DVLLAGRQLEHAAYRNRRRLLVILRPQVDLRADVEVADVVARPVLVDAGIPIGHAAKHRVVDDEERPHIAIDARVEQERSKDLGAILDADPDRAVEAADVLIPLDPVGPAPVAANAVLPV